MKKVLIIAIGSVCDDRTINFKLCPDLERRVMSELSEKKPVPCLFYSSDKNETKLKTVSKKTVFKEVSEHFNESDVEILFIKEHQQREISDLLGKAKDFVEEKHIQLYCMWNYHSNFLKGRNTSSLMIHQQQASS